MASDPKQRAFPQGAKWIDHNGRTGRDIEGRMTLRDWFAGQALVEVSGLITVQKPETFNVVAGIAYDIADAMLAEKDRRDAE